MLCIYKIIAFADAAEAFFALYLLATQYTKFRAFLAYFPQLQVFTFAPTHGRIYI